MFILKFANTVRPLINEIKCRSSMIKRQKTTYRNPEEREINVYDKSHSEKLKYKFKDEFYEQQLQNPITKSDKDMLYEYLQENEIIRKYSDLESTNKLVK